MNDISEILQDVERRLQIALDQLKNRNYEECIKICEEIIERIPIVPDAFSLRGRAYLIRIEETHGSNNMQLQMSDMLGEDIREKIDSIVFDCARAVKDFKEAIGLAEQYPNYDPRVLGGYYYFLALARIEWATIYSREVRHDLLKEAISDLLKSANYDKAGSFAQREIGQIYEKYFKDYTSARKYFALAISKENHPFDYLFYSWCCYMLGETSQADHYFKLGLAVDEKILNFGYARPLLDIDEDKQETWKKFLAHCKSIG